MTAPRTLLGLVCLLLGCSEAEVDAYAPKVTGLPPVVFAGASVSLGVDPLPDPEDPWVVLASGSPVQTTATEGGIDLVIPETSSGAVELLLLVDGAVVWRDTVQVAGYVGETEAAEAIGVSFGNLITTNQAGVTYVWGATSGGGLGRLTPSTGAVMTFDSLLEPWALRVPGPTAVAGQWLLAPSEAVAVDSLEIWTLQPSVSKVRRVPRMEIERQAAEVAPGRWLITSSSGVWAKDEANDSVVFNGGYDYNEAQVIFRSPSGDRTTFSFHGSSLGTPVFGPSGQPVFHLPGLRGLQGVAFTPDGARMIAVGYGQSYAGLLLEVEASSGALVDSVLLDLPFDPQGVLLDLDDRVFVFGVDSAYRPIIDIFGRPGYQRLGRMRTLPGERTCRFGCDDGVLGLDQFSRMLFVIEGGPNGSSVSGNGIWRFQLPPLPLEAARRTVH